jgi:U3 small nucleolar RNA-associated protein 23
MRVQRHKHARKALAFYKIAFGIVPPYRLLLDGNFVAQAVRMSIDFRRLLPRTLQADGAAPAGGPGGGATGRAAAGVFLHVTECVLDELRALGPKGAPVLAAATGGGVGVIRCHHKHGHAPGTDASACLRQLVGPANAGKFLVATQDAALRDALRGVPGTPLVLFSQNVMVLEPPSSASKRSSASREASKSALQPGELAMIARAMAGEGGGGSRSSSSSSSTAGKKRAREEDDDDDGGSGGDDDGEEGGDGDGAAAPAPPARKGPTRPPASLPALLAQAGIGVKPRSGGPKLPKRKKRKGPSGPNPLSMRKKVKGDDGGGGGADGSGHKVRRRRPGAGPGGGGAAVGDGST